MVSTKKNFGRRFIAVLLAFLVVFTAGFGVQSVQAATKKTVKVTSVKLNKTSARLYIGQKVTLKATVAPSNAIKKTVTWASDNKSVATVSTKGVVRAVSTGTCKITATAKDGSKKVGTCKVTVTTKGVALAKYAKSLNGKTYKYLAGAQDPFGTGKSDDLGLVRAVYAKFGIYANLRTNTVGNRTDILAPSCLSVPFESILNKQAWVGARVSRVCEQGSNRSVKSGIYLGEIDGVSYVFYGFLEGVQQNGLNTPPYGGVVRATIEPMDSWLSNAPNSVCWIYPGTELAWY